MNDEDMFLADEEDTDTQEDKYLLFPLGEEHYGIEIRFVREIIELQPITVVPDTPVYMKGVINLRGKIIPVMDIRLRFGMKERPYTDRTCIIIIEVHDIPVGIIVDTVAEVQEISKDNIEASPSFKGETVREYYISGLGKTSYGVKILIDVGNLLRQEDLKVSEQPSR